MKRFVLLLIPTLALAACATTKPVATDIAHAKAAPPAAPKPPSDLTGLQIYADIPQGWLPLHSEFPILLGQKETRSVIVLQAIQSWTDTPKNIMEKDLLGALKKRGCTIVARGVASGPDGADPSALWVIWKASEPHKPGEAVAGKLAVWRYEAPHDDVIFLQYSEWGAEHPALNEDFDAFQTSVKLIPVPQGNHVLYPVIPTGAHNAPQ